jgi:hypothetical protein
MTRSPEQLRSDLARSEQERTALTNQNRQLGELLRFVRRHFWLDDEGTEATNRKSGDTSLAIDAVLSGEASWQTCPACQGFQGEYLLNTFAACTTCQGRGGFLTPNNVPAADEARG